MTPENLDEAKIDDAVLALLMLGLHDHCRAWKGFDWNAMGRLYAKGLISNPRGRTKSVVLSEEDCSMRKSCWRLCSARMLRDDDAGNVRTSFAR